MTAFKYRLHPVPPVTVATIFYAPECGAELLRTYREGAKTAPDETLAILLYLNLPPMPLVPTNLHLAPAYGLMAVSVANHSDAEAAVLAMREFGPPLVDVVSPMPYTAVQKSFDEPFAHFGMLDYEKGQYLSELSDQVIDGIIDRAPARGVLLSMVHI